MAENPFAHLEENNPFKDLEPENPFAKLEQKPTFSDEFFESANKTVQAIGQVYPMLELGATAISGAVAMPVSGLVGLGAAGLSAVGVDVDPTKAIEKTQDVLTFQPVSDLGQHLVQSAFYPLEVLDEISTNIADKAFDSTMEVEPAIAPAVGTAVKTGIEALPAVAVPAMKKAKATVQGRPVKETFIEGVTGENVTQFLDADLDNVRVGNKSLNINFEKIDSPENVKAAIQEVGTIFEGQINDARRGVITNTQTKKLADQLGMTTDQLLKRRKGQAFNAEQAYAARTILVDSANELVELATKARGGAKEDMVKFMAHFERHKAIQEQVSGLTAEAGRALQQFQIQAKTDKAKLTALEDIIDASGGARNIDDLAKMVTELDSHQKLNKFNREVKVSDILMEAWINSLLSGPKTHAVNVTSNSLVALWTVPEQLVAAGMSRLRPGSEKIYLSETPARLYGMVEGGREGFLAASKTWLRGTPSDLVAKIETPKGYNVIPGLAGDIIRLPGRALLTEDEFFKTMGYYMELNSLAMRQATKEGLTGRARAERIVEIKRNPPEDISLAAIDAARYQTFTKPLGPMGKAIQQFTNSHPGWKLLVPFVRTPTNIIKFYGERSPLGLFSQEIRKDLKDPGPKGDIARARMAMGTVISTVVAKMASEGHITGGGPQEPSARAAYYAAGKQPYSIRLGDTYYSLSRLEPLGMIFGVSADFAEISGYATEAEADEIAAAITLSVTKNLTSKTWLKGFSDFVQASTDPGRYLEKFVHGYAGTLIPTGVAQLNQLNDPVLRRADTLIEKIKSRIPGYSKDLLPKRNIWGDPIILEGGLGPDLISPVYVSTEKRDRTTDEVIRLELSISPPRKKIGSVELDPRLHDELSVIQGKNLKRALDNIILSPNYSKMTDGVKQKVLETAIQTLRRTSEIQFFQRHPEILTEIQLEKIKALQ